MGANTETHIWNNCRRLETLKHTVPNGASPSNSYHYYLQLIIIQEEKIAFVNGVSLGIQTTIKGRTHAQQQMANTKHNQCYFQMVFFVYLLLMLPCQGIFRLHIIVSDFFLIVFSVFANVCLSASVCVTTCLLVMPYSALFYSACILIYVIIIFQMYVCFPMKEKMKL